MVCLFFAAIVLGLLFQKSKTVTVFLIVLCAVIFSFNTENPDYSGYFGTYNSYYTRDIYWEYFQRYEVLYRFLVITCNLLNVSYNGFRLIVFILCVSLVGATISKLTDRINLPIALYMIFPFIMDCIQIRNMIGGAFVVYAMQFLLVQGEDFQQKKNMMKYTVCILVASLFHYVAIAYLLYTVCFFLRWFQKMYGIGIITSTVFTLITFLNRRRLSADTGYFNTGVSIATFVFLAGITVGLLITIRHFIKSETINSLVDDEFKGAVFRFLLTSTIFIPVLIFHYDLFRFIRNLLLVFSCLAGCYVSKVKVIYSRKGFIILSIVSISVVFTVSYGLLLWRSAYYPYEISLIDEILNSVKLHW